MAYQQKVDSIYEIQADGIKIGGKYDCIKIVKNS